MQQVIKQGSSCRGLGITMSDDAKYTEQIDKVSKKAKQKYIWILRTFYCQEKNFLCGMFNTYDEEQSQGYNRRTTGSFTNFS